ncbi:glycosyltransferase family 2 protein [Clostridium sulfidigenes]|uniref:glycosyltransferase family 2 protein n=1 Tax=Clostridium sulfidigenes TaxID=318464 RepID=UPI003F8A38E5
MKYSVLMSVYVKENPEFLRLSLDSMVNQTLKPDEIVLIKDGPLTQELEEVLNEYINKYNDLFNIIEFETNKGLGEALRVGVISCKNELIARMDTDDIAKLDRCEKQVNEFIENSMLDIVGCQIIEFESEISNELSRRILPTSHEEIYKFAKKRCPFNHMTVMYKKNSVINAGNYQPLPLFEDYYLWTRMLISGCKAKNINECLVYARTGKEMINRRGGVGYMKKILTGKKKIFKSGFISFKEFIYSAGLHSIVCLMPPKLRGVTYSKLLRR